MAGFRQARTERTRAFEATKNVPSACTCMMVPTHMITLTGPDEPTTKDWVSKRLKILASYAERSSLWRVDRNWAKWLNHPIYIYSMRNVIILSFSLKTSATLLHWAILPRKAAVNTISISWTQLNWVMCPKYQAIIGGWYREEDQPCGLAQAAIGNSYRSKRVLIMIRCQTATFEHMVSLLILCSRLPHI